jgi:hypothetical protein
MLTTAPHVQRRASTSGCTNEAGGCPKNLLRPCTIAWRAQSPNATRQMTLPSSVGPPKMSGDSNLRSMNVAKRNTSPGNVSSTSRLIMSAISTIDVAFARQIPPPPPTLKRGSASDESSSRNAAESRCSASSPPIASRQRSQPSTTARTPPPSASSAASAAVLAQPLGRLEFPPPSTYEDVAHPCVAGHRLREGDDKFGGGGANDGDL